jgi:hypothetical protein
LVDLGFVPTAKTTNTEARRDQQTVGGSKYLPAVCTVFDTDLNGVEAPARRRRRGRIDCDRVHESTLTKFVGLRGDTVSRLEGQLSGGHGFSKCVAH